MKWIECSKELPKKVGYYLVWIPAWEGYCNEDAFDVAWWNCSEWGELNAFSAIADGAPVTHWSIVPPPNKRVQTDPLPAVDDGGNSNIAGG